MSKHLNLLPVPSFWHDKWKSGERTYVTIVFSCKSCKEMSLYYVHRWPRNEPVRIYGVRFCLQPSGETVLHKRWCARFYLMAACMWWERERCLVWLRLVAPPRSEVPSRWTPMSDVNENTRDCINYSWKKYVYIVTIWCYRCGYHVEIFGKLFILVFDVCMLSQRSVFAYLEATAARCRL